jgi:sugar lactone lactonase YvrE
VCYTGPKEIFMKFRLHSAALLLCLAIGLLAACGGGGGSSGGSSGSGGSNNTVAVSGVSFSGITAGNFTIGLEVGRTSTQTAVVAPDNATNKNVTWESNASDVASVVGSGANGTITGVAPGTATITVKTADGGKTATLTVNVSAPAPIITSYTPTSGRHGETITLTGTNFSAVPGENRVTFNGYPGMVQSATPTQLIVTVPKNLDASGRVQVTVAGRAGAAVEGFTYVPTYVVSTLAGSGEYGFADGTGAEAKFNNPNGVAVDAAGNIYVADTFNNRIRKITAAGEVSTLAGSGRYGVIDGAGTAADFGFPSGVAVDTAGNVYVADWGYDRIRKITAAGEVSTLVGSSAFGLAYATIVTADFGSPMGVAVDTVGNVYVADWGSGAIRKITAAGEVSTLAGPGYGFADGMGAEAKFANIYGIAVDTAGNVYVPDRDNNRIRKITAVGEVSTLAGSSDAGFVDGRGAAAKFSGPYGVAVDTAGNVYVADTYNHSIRKITAAGEVSSLAGSGEYGSADGVGAAAQFAYPIGIAVDVAGNVYVGDVNNSSIRKLTPE